MMSSINTKNVQSDPSDSDNNSDADKQAQVLLNLQPPAKRSKWDISWDNCIIRCS